MKLYSFISALLWLQVSMAFGFAVSHPSDSPNQSGLVITTEHYEGSPFITTWEVSANDLSITIPTEGSGYDYRVDWGDGTSESGFSGDASHTYASAGTYQVAIQGDFPRIYFNNGRQGKDIDKIIAINQWGDIQWESMARAFAGCQRLVYQAVDTPDLSDVTTTWEMFRQATLFNGNLNDWDVSNITNMGSMFEGCVNFNQPLDQWDVSNLTDTEQMFIGCQAFDQPLNSWDVSGLWRMPAMFRGCVNFNQPLDNWDVSNVVDFGQSFMDSGFDQSLGSWDISQGGHFGGMLDNCQMSAASYDATLIGWSTLSDGEASIPTNVTLGAINLTYCEGEDARNTLINSYEWSFSSDRKDCSGSANNLTKTITVPNRETFKGNTVTVSLLIDPMPTSEDNITSYEFDLEIPEGIVYLGHATEGSLSENEGVLSNVTDSNIRIDYTTVNPLEGDLPLIKLLFQTNERGEYPIIPRNFYLNGSLQEDVRSGMISVLEIMEELPELTGLEWVTVEGGSFQMGCPGAEFNCRDNELPVRSVTLSDFAMSKYEITHAQFILFLNDLDIDADGYHEDPEFGTIRYINIDIEDSSIKHDGIDFYFEESVYVESDQVPVGFVSWYGANAFAKWVGGRLPTEAEWEYAASGGAEGQPTLFAGSNDLSTVGWFNANSSFVTKPVGQKLPNELGLYDMSGNSIEFCQDYFGDYGEVSETDPTGPAEGTTRVIRGGSVGHQEQFCRVTFRTPATPERTSFFNVGFRIVFPITITQVLSSESTEPSSIQVYPNPATHSFHLTGTTEEFDKVTLLDLEGKTVKTYRYEQDASYSVDDLQSGWYMIVLQTPKGKRVVRKLVVRD